MAAQSVLHLTQSRYYSPVLNGAVFDGPIRIYFAQHQENLALKVYFRLQQYFNSSYASFRKNVKDRGQTVFLMLYPTLESFENSFTKKAGQKIAAERLGEDHVLGISGPLEETQYEEIFETVKSTLLSLGLHPDSASPLV